MKNNLISAIAGWKSAALLALVAMVAAVAFSGVLSTTQTADAQLGDNQTVAPGATVTLPGASIDGIGSGVWTTWTISTTGAADASFESGGGTTLVCQDVARAGTCDADAADGVISVKVKIASDSGAGAVVVRAGVLTAAQTSDAVVLTVDPGLVPAKITLTPSKKAHSASVTTADELPAMNVKVTNSAGKGVAVNLSLTTTLGLFSAGCTTNGTLACAAGPTRATPDDGTTDGTLATVPSLSPAASRPGVATVTATVVGYPSVTVTATVTFFGPAKNIEVAPQQGSIQTGGKTFIVVTVTDAADSPVSSAQFGQTATPVTPKGPSTAAKVLGTNPNVDYDANGNRRVDKGDIPACGDDVDSADPDATPSTNLTSDGTDAGDDITAGTNDDGKCVIQVTADGPPAPAARGPHTVQVVLNATTSATATINVGGPPASIAHDAPARVDALSEHKVTVTVTDDEGVAVGAQAIEVIAIEGQLRGTITASAPATTTDGKASFSFLAPSGSGNLSFLVRAGTLPGRIQHLIEVAVGPEPEEPPEAPSATWNNELVSGQNVVVWNGADGADQEKLPEWLRFDPVEARALWAAANFDVPVDSIGIRVQHSPQEIETGEFVAQSLGVGAEAWSRDSACSWCVPPPPTGEPKEWDLLCYGAGDSGGTTGIPHDSHLVHWDSRGYGYSAFNHSHMLETVHPEIATGARALTVMLEAQEQEFDFDMRVDIVTDIQRWILDNAWCVLPLPVSLVQHYGFRSRLRDFAPDDWATPYALRRESMWLAPY